MSEPHELEERVADAWQRERNNWLVCIGPPRVYEMHNAHVDDTSCFTGTIEECRSFVTAKCARAVLDLVRQEQEAESPGLPLMNIRAWWLSHAAKETSNG